MIRVVIDTNVLVSGLWRPSGNCALVVDAVRSFGVTAVLDDRIFAEYAGVLRRPKLGLSVATVERVLAHLASDGERIVVGPTLVLPVADAAPDPKDLMFIEVAAATRVDAIVTGNERHFAWTRGLGLVVLSPAEFVERLRLGA